MGNLTSIHPFIRLLPPVSQSIFTWGHHGCRQVARREKDCVACELHIWIEPVGLAASDIP